MKLRGQNHPFVIWTACFLWLMSMFAIAWSLLLFFSLNDILLLSGMDLVNAFVLLSGIIMLPTNIIILCAIANGKKIDYKAKVVCCPLWLSILWIILINAIGAVICIMKTCSCRDLITKQITNGMKQYRSVLKYKNFLDNLQWSLKCCGLDSYKDWFNKDWYDRISDYEWDISSVKRNKLTKMSPEYIDSVPLSCCKSGSCISNYLTELGTYSINTSGCASLMFRIVMLSLNIHLVMFIIIVLSEIIMLKLIMTYQEEVDDGCGNAYDVMNIMPVRENYMASKGSILLNPDEEEKNYIDGLRTYNINTHSN